ncbi:hypothetical protein SEUCBS139899_003671 [Sporothrix eucalyptigena]|uniref:Uncharacterized protein n=1 Tax=Sporothrix eucalyptigena TaxID=1812306 RepID=A0ABP0BQF9_9PEZI
MKPEYAPLFIVLGIIPLALFAIYLYKSRNHIYRKVAENSPLNNPELDVELLQQFEMYRYGRSYLVDYIPARNKADGYMVVERQIPNTRHLRPSTSQCESFARRYRPRAGSQSQGQKKYRERVYEAASIPQSKIPELEAPPPAYTPQLTAADLPLARPARSYSVTSTAENTPTHIGRQSRIRVSEYTTAFEVEQREDSSEEGEKGEKEAKQESQVAEQPRQGERRLLEPGFEGEDIAEPQCLRRDGRFSF